MPPANETTPQYEIAPWRLDAKSQDNVDDFVNHAGYEDGLPFVKAFVDRNGPGCLEMKNKDGETAFLRAASHNLTEMMDFLGGQGAQKDLVHEDLPLIHCLARRGRRAAVGWLIARGAPVDLRGGKWNSTPLLFAAQALSVGLVRDLIAAGADVNARDSEGNTPLMRAAIQDSAGNIAALVENGADVEARNHKGSSAMELAILFRHRDAMSALVDAGASMTDKGREGQELAAYAAQRGLGEWLGAEYRRHGEAIAGRMSAGLEKPVPVRRLQLKTPGKG